MSVHIELNIYCTCGAELRCKFIWPNYIEVFPCEDCLSEKYDRGYEQGQEDYNKSIAKSEKEGVEK